jgi:thermitase
MRLGLVAAIATVLALGASSEATPAAPAHSLGPNILEMQPAAPTQLSYLNVSGQALMASDGTCSITLNGDPLYVETCRPGKIRAIVPITAQSGAIRVVADGEASIPVSISVSPRPSPASPTDGIEVGQIHIKIVNGSDVSAIVASRGDGPLAATPLGSPGESDLAGWYRLSVQPGQEIAKAASYSQVAGVEYSGPVPVAAPTATANDPLYQNGSQWNLPKIQAELAWDISRGSGVTIGMMDDGLNPSHEDLSGHALPGWNCQGGTDVSPVVSTWHGTAVASTLAAVTDNNKGIAGLAWDSRVLPLRAYGANCDALFLVEKAIAAQSRVMNMSIAYGIPFPALCATLGTARASGMVLVAAADNHNTSNIPDPAGCDHVIAVGATIPDDSKAEYSNYGPELDISAPGGQGPVGACTDALIPVANYPSGYTSACGTSFAAPQVASVAALLAARGFSACTIEETLLNPNNVDPINWQGGVGRLNAGKALAWWGGGPIVSNGNVPDGSLVREESSPDVYVVYGGAKFSLVDPATFNAMGFSWRNVQCMPDYFLSQNGIRDAPRDKTLLREFSSAPIYVVHCDARFHVPDAPTLTMLITNGYANQPVYVVPNGGATAFTTTPRDGCLMREVTTPDLLFVMCAGRRWQVPSSYVLDRLQAVGGVTTLQVLWDGALAGVSSTSSLNTCHDTDGDHFSDIVEA